MKHLLTVTLKLIAGLMFAILVVTLAVSIQYYATTIYNDPNSKPFEGEYFYNPYDGYQPHTLKANFHAHSVAHMGLTNGSNEVEEVQAFYSSKGYDIASISNYQKITVDSNNVNYIPVYEHGYNIKKVHQLVINAQKVSFFDFAGFQGKNQKQEVFSWLKNPKSIVAIAHPKFMNGYPAKDLKKLRGYKLIEVFTRYRSTTALWDSVLSAGMPVWLLASDDSHDISRRSDAGRRWTRIAAHGRSADSVVAALRRGCHYGVSNGEISNDINSLLAFNVRNDSIELKLSNTADVIKFIGDGGMVYDEFYHTSTARFGIPTYATYVRVEVKTQSETILLNPVVRFNGKSLSDTEVLPEVDYPKTTLTRLLFVLLSSFNLFLLLLFSSKFRQRLRFPPLAFPKI